MTVTHLKHREERGPEPSSDQIHQRHPTAAPAALTADWPGPSGMHAVCVLGILQPPAGTFTGQPLPSETMCLFLQENVVEVQRLLEPGLK